MKLELNVRACSEDIVEGEGVDTDLSVVQIDEYQSKVHELLFEAESLVGLLIVYYVLVSLRSHHVREFNINGARFVGVDVKHLLRSTIHIIVGPA